MPQSEQFIKYADDTVTNMTTALTALTVDVSGTDPAPAIIESDSEQIVAAERTKYIGGIKRKIIAMRKSYTGPLDTLKKRFIEVEKKALAPLELNEKQYKLAIRAYDERKQDEERKARMEAERIQREEEQRLRAEAREAREVGTIAGEVEAMKHEEKAQAVAEKPVEVVVTVPKISKLLTRKNYRAEVLNQAILSYGYMIPDMPKLNALARSAKGDQTMAPAGVKFVEVDV